MQKYLKSFVGLVGLMATSSAAMAQASDWQYGATVYLFTPETTVSVGDVEGSLDFSDALKNLDMAFMGAFDAHNGTWGLLADYMLTDLTFEQATPGADYSGLSTSLKTQILNGYLTYRAYEEPTVSIDVAAGFRLFDTRTKLTLSSGTATGGSSSVSDNWADPVIGARANFQMSEKWSGTAFADYGGFSSDSTTWQVLLTLDYQFDENWAGRLGYRKISVDHKINGSDFKYEQSGPLLGVTYKF
ncbi:porin family protein (plasmid) [Falsihalocynthiibacter sp. SS001]|uniref:porin family protein n=1 Tax=Falsihalocynthiibacter sp. SS001 TaxID=3349698 RepID=UPI0036D34799